MSEEVLKKLMDKVARDECIKIYDYEYASGLNKKDGFLSSMVHVKLCGKNVNNIAKTLNLLVKFAPNSTKFRKQMPIRETFRRECLMYDRIVPSMKTMLMKNSNLSPSIDFITKLYTYTLEEGDEALVFENLKTSNYKLWDYKKPMNDEHVRYVLERYGRLHANGYALRRYHPDLYDDLTSTIQVSLLADPDWIELHESFDKILAIVQKGLKQSSNDVRVLDAFQRYKDNCTKYLMQSTDDRYKTILHGDCWTNNFMFNYDDDETTLKPTKVKFLDFQMIADGSPANDISYFLYANISSDMYENLDEYKRIYHDSLSKQLKELNLDPDRILTLDDFERQMKRHAKYGITMAFFIIYIKLFKSEIKDHEDLENTDECIFDQFNEDGKDLTIFYRHANDLINHCYQRGYL